MAESSSGESLAAHLASVNKRPDGFWSRELGTAVGMGEPQGASDRDGSVWDDDFADVPDLKRFEKGLWSRRMPCFLPSDADCLVALRR